MRGERKLHLFNFVTEVGKRGRRKEESKVEGKEERRAEGKEERIMGLMPADRQQQRWG